MPPTKKEDFLLDDDGDHAQGSASEREPTSPMKISAGCALYQESQRRADKRTAEHRQLANLGMY